MTQSNIKAEEEKGVGLEKVYQLDKQRKISLIWEQEFPK